MKKLLIATHNQAKITEIKYGLKTFILKNNQKIKILTLNDVKVEKSPEETGKTFKENSIIKAKFYGQLTNLPTIADDGGLVIPYLNDEPGVKSNRWLGYHASDQELINHTLSRLKNVKNITQRKAFLKTVLALYHPKKNLIFTQSALITGYISFKPSNKKIPGYPFRSLFIVSKLNKYYDNLSEKEHLKINHRLKALKKLAKKIVNLL